MWLLHGTKGLSSTSNTAAQTVALCEGKMTTRGNNGRHVCPAHQGVMIWIWFGANNPELLPSLHLSNNLASFAQIILTVRSNKAPAFHLVRIWFLEVRVALLCHRLDKHEALTRLAWIPALLSRYRCQNQTPREYSRTPACLPCLFSTAIHDMLPVNLAWQLCRFLPPKMAPIYINSMAAMMPTSILVLTAVVRWATICVTKIILSSEAAHLCLDEQRCWGRGGRCFPSHHPFLSGQWLVASDHFLHIVTTRELMPYFLKHIWKSPSLNSCSDTACLKLFACINIPLKTIINGVPRGRKLMWAEKKQQKRGNSSPLERQSISNIKDISQINS